MKTNDQNSWNNRDSRFESDDDIAIADSRHQVGDYNLDTDEDDQNLSDDDKNGRDLDTDGGDEWDADNVNEKDLDEDDLEDNDEANFELHQVKNDKFGSLGRSITNEAEPDPDEIPEQEEANQEDIDYPDDDRMEQAKDDEVSYHEPKGVEAPNTTEAPKKKVATLDNLDSTFVDDSHDRQNRRIVDHEPGAGSTTGEHGAYNL